MSKHDDMNFMEALEESIDLNKRLLSWLEDNKSKGFIYEDSYFTIRAYLQDLLETKSDYMKYRNAENNGTAEPALSMKTL